MSKDNENNSEFRFDTNRTSGGTIFFDNRSNASVGINLGDPSAKLKQELAATKQEYEKLLRHCQTLEHEVKRLSSMRPAHSFSAKEIKIMLSRMHPDKNSGKEIYKAITQKLLVMK